jgi:N-acetylmuramic acid 6-phosphate etherase
MPPDPHLPQSPWVTEQVNPATIDIDRMSSLQIAQVMNAEDAGVAAAVSAELPHIARGIDAIAARLRGGGRLIYLGAGTSGRLGVLDASECPPTFNTPPTLVIGWLAGGADALGWAFEEVEDRADAGRADAERLGVSARDVLVGISASGRTPYVLGAVAYAREQGALTISLTCNKGTPLEQACAIVIAPVVGPEVIAGSTRLKAGTAQKMVLNMLSTGAMVVLGKTLGNLMVDVRATNDKLRQRALDTVRRATGLDEEVAADLLRAAGGEARVAILAGRAAITPAVARERLAQHSGSVRAALDALDTRDALP